MTFAAALFRRRLLQGAPLMAVAASVLPRGGTLVCMAAWTLYSLSRARANYPYPRRRGGVKRALSALFLFAAVFFFLTAPDARVMPPSLQAGGAAVFAVCAAANAVKPAGNASDRLSGCARRRYAR